MGRKPKSRTIGRPRGVNLLVRDLPRPAREAPPGPPAQLQVRDGTGVALVTVDSKWLPYLQQFSWQLEPSGYVKRGHAFRGPDDRLRTQTVRLHSDIAQPGKGLEVDHINGDKTDNRESNLRSTTRMSNQRNMGLSALNTTGFKGVQFSKQHRKYVAVIHASGRRYALFADTAEAAALKYDQLAREHFGADARFNFPRPGERGLDGQMIPAVES